MGLWLGLATDHVAVVGELTDEVVGLVQQFSLGARALGEA
jgi:hypothetical protein